MEKLRFGIIGTNFISDWLLEAAKEEKRFQANGIYSRNRETCALRKTLGFQLLKLMNLPTVLLRDYSDLWSS